MIEKLEYKGFWWLPNNPENKISGTLQFTPNEGAILDLVGSFRDLEHFNQSFQPEIVLGISSDGKNITLYKCFETKSRVSIPGLIISSLYASVVFVGAHFLKAEDIKFKSLSIHFSHLDEWVNISGIDIDFPTDTKEILIRYKKPEPIQVVLNDSLRLLIDFSTEYPFLSHPQKEAGIKQKIYIIIEPSTEKPFEEYFPIMYHIRNFLSLATTELVQPLLIEGKTETNKEIIANTVHYPSVGIFYQLPNIGDETEKLTPYLMLFRYNQISNQFDVFLNNWFQKANYLETVYDLYFGTLYNPHLYLNNQFLNLIQAIESYHRKTMKNNELPEDRHQERIKEILNAVPSKFTDWLEWKLKYSNEVNLRQRLKDILEFCSKISERLISDQEAFIGKTVDTRNYLTHFDPELEQRAVKGKELYDLTSRLKVLLQTIFLKELGLSDDRIRELISSNIKYSSMLSS